MADQYREIDLALLQCCDSEAARDIGKITELLDAGANPNVVHWGGRFNEHRTPLLALMQHRDPDPEPTLLSLLISRGADPNHPTPDKQTPLHSAARYNFTALCRLLIEAGANPNIVQDGYYNGAPLHQTIATHKDSSIETVQLLLDAGADPNLRHNGRTVLRKAIEAQAWQVVSLLLSRGARTDNDEPESLFYAEGTLGAAIQAGATEAQLRWLASQGASAIFKDSNGDTAMLQASWRAPAMVNVLVALGGNTEHLNKKGRTALVHHCALGGSLDGAKALISVGAALNAQDPEGKTALWYAVEKQREDLVRELLAAGADREIATIDGQRPLDLAKSRSLDLLSKLIAPEEDTPEAPLVEHILRAIEVGRHFQSSKEKLAFRYRSEGVEHFSHAHSDNPRRERFVSRGLVKQRLVWLALHRPTELSEYLRELPEPMTKKIEADAIATIVKEQEPTLTQLAQRSLDGVNLGEVLIAGLWAGARFFRSDKEGAEEWLRDGDEIVQQGDGEGGSFQQRYSRAQAVAYWSSWGNIVDGLVFSGSSFYSALDDALKALGVETLAAYIARHAAVPERLAP